MPAEDQAARAVRCSAGCRIVDVVARIAKLSIAETDWYPLRSQKLVRVRAGFAAADHSRGRNGHLVGDAGGLLCALVVTKEEQLVLDDRATDRAAILLPTGRRKRLAGQLCEGIARLLSVIVPIVKAATMKFVAARLNLNRDGTGDGFANFRVEVLISNLGFLNGVEVWIDDDDPKMGSWLSVPSNSNAVPLKCWPLTKIC